jgi:hypothetical protein
MSRGFDARGGLAWFVFRDVFHGTQSDLVDPRRRGTVLPAGVVVLDRVVAAHYAKVGTGIVWTADEFDRWADYVHSGIRGSGYDATGHLGAVLATLHTLSLLLGKRDGREHAIGVIVGFRGEQPYGIVAVRICDLFVVVGPEQVGVAAGKRVRGKRRRHRVGPCAVSGAVTGRPARDYLHHEMFTPIRERGLIARDTGRCTVKVVDG